MKEEIEIKYLPFPLNVRRRYSAYLGTDVSVCLREIIDNATTELGAGYGDTLGISTNFNGFNLVFDNGRGLPINLTEVEGETMTQAYLSLSKLHAGSHLGDNEELKGGDGNGSFTPSQNGLGSSCVNAVSEVYIVLSKITEENYNKSISEVKNLWEKSGPRSKKDLFYILVFEKGYRVFESAGKLKDLEKQIFSGMKDYQHLPENVSTMVLFKPDPTIYEDTKMEIPISNLQYFLLIQEKFFKRKNKIYIDGNILNNTFKPYQFELVKSIIPKDTSANKRVNLYMTFEVDPSLGDKELFGSVNGLDSKGLHIKIAESCFKAALKDLFKIKHDYLTKGLKVCVIVLAQEVMFSGQTKENLQSISKVKISDFADVVKEIQKIFKKSPDYWQAYVDRLDKYAESMKSFGAAELAEKFISTNSGVGLYRNKTNLVPGFTEATGKNRMDCELFLVEGLSASSSLVTARPDTTKFAICPLRGRVMNVSGMTAKRALENQIIYSIFSVIGLGLDVNNVVKDCNSYEEAIEIVKQKSRYGKIIIATDADSDGSAIANELLLMFSKFARFMIDLGLIYRAISPLWKGISKTTGKETYYYPNDPYNINTGFPLDMDEKKHYSRYKGLGSLCPETGEVEDAFFNTNTRKLLRITPEGLDYALGLNENIDSRKQLLSNKGILTNPYKFND